jgi:cytochrome c peroxidase
MSLWNVAYNRWFFWDGRVDSLWSQALVPMERDDEFGSDRAWCAQVIFNDAELRGAYERVFGTMPDLADHARFPVHAKPRLPGEPDAPDDSRHAAWQAMSDGDRHAIDMVFSNAGKAIAAYETQIVSRDAPFDRFAQGLREHDPEKMSAISDSAKRGLKMFIGRGNCRLCHSGPNFSDGEFHSVAVGPLGGSEPYDSARYGSVDTLKRSEFNAAGPFSDDHGGEAAQRLAALVNKPDNWGQFKTPSLRNVARTPPYMHQGQYATLREVLTHYSTLGDAVQLGHHREKILVPLNLSEQEMSDMEAFLQSLSGAALPEELLSKPSSPR